MWFSIRTILHHFGSTWTPFLLFRKTVCVRWYPSLVQLTGVTKIDSDICFAKLIKCFYIAWNIHLYALVDQVKLRAKEPFMCSTEENITMEMDLIHELYGKYIHKHFTFIRHEEIRRWCYLICISCGQEIEGNRSARAKKIQQSKFCDSLQKETNYWRKTRIKITKNGNHEVLHSANLLVLRVFILSWMVCWQQHQLQQR